jgi:hypothetical protein
MHTYSSFPLGIEDPLVPKKTEYYVIETKQQLNITLTSLTKFWTECELHMSSNKMYILQRRIQRIIGRKLLEMAAPFQNRNNNHQKSVFYICLKILQWWTSLPMH